MKTPFWKTYVAIAVLAGLGAYIYFVEARREEKPEKPKEKVLAIDKAKVKELTLAHVEGEPIRLVKESSGWKMTSPLAVPADSSEADSLVSSLGALEIDEVVVESATSLADYGLDPPKTAVGLLLEGASEPQKLLLGEKAPGGSGLYAKLPSRARVFTIPAYLEATFNKKPFDLRDREVLHVKRDAVKGLEIAGPEGGYALARDDKGEWAFTKPLATKAGRWGVEGLLGTIENLRMESVAAEQTKELKPFGLDKPARTVTVVLGDGTSRMLAIGGSAETPAVKNQDKTGAKGKNEPEKPKETQKPRSYYARETAGRLVAVIPSALVDDLAKGMKELRAKRLLDVATYEIEGFDVQSGGVTRVYARSSVKDKDGIDVYKWKRTTPEAKDLDTNKVQDVLFKVGGIESEDFVDSPGTSEKYGLDKPLLKVTLRYSGDKAPVWFELGQKDGATYARRPDDAALLKLESAKAEELIKAFKEL